MAFSANSPICVAGTPADAPFDTQGMKWLEGDGGIYEFNTAFTELKEGKKDKELCDGSWGRVVYVTILGEACDPKTHETVGKLNVTLFLNTKSHYLASQVAALCGCYNKEEERSEYVPTVRTDKNGKEHWNIPALEKKNFIVAVAKSGSYTNQNGESIDQYQLVGVLAPNFVTVAHRMAGKVDHDTAVADYKRLQKNLENQIKFFKDQAKADRDAAISAGAGANPYGIQPVTTADEGTDEFNKVFSNGGKAGVAYVQAHGKDVTETDTTNADIPF